VLKKIVCTTVLFFIIISLGVLEVGSETEPNAYYSYELMVNELKMLIEKNEHIMYMYSIGTTYQNREIWVIKISDNPYIDEDEPDVLYLGAHHGNEKISYEVLIYFVKYIAENYNTPQVQYIVNNRELYVIPMVNPDAVEENKRKNQEPNYGPLGNPLPDIGIGNPIGVDLNRNYDWMWGLIYPLTDSANPYSEQYQGEEPFSEKETCSIRDFVSAHKFVITLSYHCYGEMILYPWGYTPQPAEDEDMFLAIGKNISAINGYKVMQASELYLTSGDACDWLYGAHNVYPFTIELGKEPTPPYEEVIDICKIHVEVNLYVAEIAGTLKGPYKPTEQFVLPQEIDLGPTWLMVLMIVIIFTIVYGGFAKCINIALMSEKQKYAE